MNFVHKIFGLGSESTASQERPNEKEGKKKGLKACGSSVDRAWKNARRAQSHVQYVRPGKGSALCYTLNNEDLHLQTKHAKKYNKHKLLRVSQRGNSKQETSGNSGLSVNDGKSSCRGPAMLVITRQDPSFLIKAEELNLHGKTFDKYIPIEDFDSPMYCVSKLDRHFPLCWFDVQAWYRETRARHKEQLEENNKAGARVSVSDTSVYSTPPRRTGSNESQASETFSKSPKSPKTIQQLINNDRFGLEVNRTYCEVTSSLTPNYVIELLLQLPGKADLSLCHLKTEMIVFCLQKFFFPAAGIHVMWVKDLKAQAIRLCSSRGLQRHLPVPAQMSVNTSDFVVDHLDKSFQEMQALMIASPDAAVLLKHGELCFLDTLAAVTDIEPNKLIVFQQTRKSNQLTVIHEIS